MSQRTVNQRRPSPAAQLATVESPTPIVPMTGFAEFGVSRPVVEALAMRGITGTFAIQELVLRDAIAGRDVLARSRTGSGKTLAFAVPIVERLTPSGKSPTALILAPTRELASQVTEDFLGWVCDRLELFQARRCACNHLAAQFVDIRNFDIESRTG